MFSLIKSDLYKTIQDDLSENDGKIFIQKGKYCAGHNKCEGIFYFNSKEQPIIKVATGGKTEEEWFGILIHEYCHFLQWYENSKIWEEFDRQDFTFENAISNPKKFKKEILVLLKLELDCEKRAIKIIKNNKLFCTKEYTKFANAILYKYGYLYVNNIWPNSGEKYKAIAGHCPNVLLKSHLNYIEIPNSINTLYSS
jgi:hypothetical protein